MRVLMNVRIPHEQFNAALKDGSAGSKMNRILEAIKPEAVYFTEHCGHRGAVLVVDLPDPSKIPFLAEPVVDRRGRSCEIDVVAQARFPGGIQEPDQGRPLQRPGLAADEYDDAMVRHARGGSQKVITIARDQRATTLAGQPQHLVVRRGHRQHLAQLDDGVPQCFQREADVIRHVVVEQEPHAAGADIWRATSRSISPRWSS